ncbi:MAG: hypothetical protein IJ808_04210 [Muribaculaceae bacterium]|nr:hypothetical protein [Muribaculaceae bacterium]
MRNELKMMVLLLLFLAAWGLTACDSDEPSVENQDVYYVTNYEVKFSPNTLMGFIAKAYYVNEAGERVMVGLSNSIDHIIPLTTAKIPDYLQIHTELTRRAGLDKYDCVVDLGIEIKKYRKTGEYLETFYSKQKTACSVESYPVKQMDNDHFEASFTLEAKKDKHGKWN